MNRMQWMALTAAMSSTAALGIAQEHKSQPPAAQTTPAPKTTMSTSDKAPCVCLARELVGKSVTNPANENIGKIEDVVIRPGGEVSYAVLSFGGVMGVGDKLFAIPWRMLKSADDMNKEMPQAKHGEKIVLSIDKERLKNAPGFDKKNWPTMANAEWMKDVDTYYVTELHGSGSGVMEAGAKSPFYFKTTELKGMNIETPGGDKLGDIEDVAVDVNGHVSYVVVSVGGFLGMGERHVAVPWKALQVNREGEKGDKKKIVLPTTKDRLEKAPQFSGAKEKWSQMCDPNWISTVYEYYSVEPYWSRDDHP